MRGELAYINQGGSLRVVGFRGLLASQSRVIPFLCFAALLLIGIGIFRNYGVSWDERVQREYGEKVYNYIVDGDRQLFTDRHRYYGPVFELALYSLERGLDLNDTRDVYVMRHLVTFLMFWLGAVGFYLLCRHELGSWKLAVLGSGFLILSPRIFAHAFYNSKDIPFMCVFIIGVFTLVRYIEIKSMARAAAHAVVCALLIDIRIVGVFLGALTVAFIAYEALRCRAVTPQIKRIGRSFGLYLAILVSLTVLLWPTLWRDPLGNFIRVFEGMRNFPWEATVLYRGAAVWSTALPWHYIPVWISISTPIVLTVLFIVGLATSVWFCFRPSDSWVVGRRVCVLGIAWFFLPLGYSIISRAVLYDAWRHTFFIYPALVMLSLIGFAAVRRVIDVKSRGVTRWLLNSALAGLIVLNLGFTVVFMVRSHPHQNVYFNRLVGGVRGAEGKFDLDYWGLSYRKALEYILENDQDDRVILYAATAPGRYNADILRPDARKRLVFVSRPHKAEYYVTNLRWERSNRLPGEELYSVRVDGVRIVAVQKLGSRDL